MEHTEQQNKDYGPLAYFQGVWESQAGDDIAPGDDRGVENNKYREQMIFERIGQVNNHEQIMFGVKYTTKAWRLGVTDPFHEDTGKLHESGATQLQKWEPPDCMNGIQVFA